MDAEGGAVGEPACFPVELDLPDVDPALLTEAAAAVAAEGWGRLVPRRLRATRVDVLAQAGGWSGRRPGGLGGPAAVAVLSVEGVGAFDWTWEGALAFALVQELDVVPGELDAEQLNAQAVRWRGEVLEVDEAAGQVFVALRDPANVPGRGVFYVQPYDHLKALDAVYGAPAFDRVRGRLGPRLAAACGGIHPRVAGQQPVGGALPGFEDWWGCGWSVLWGPPGTGKTYTTGRQVAAALRDPGERVLVVSTTHRATDEVALSVGAALRVGGRGERGGGDDDALPVNVCRVGRGGRYADFADRGLACMLRGGGGDDLAQQDALRDRLSGLRDGEDRAMLRLELSDLMDVPGAGTSGPFLDPRVRGVVMTVAGALNRLVSDAVRGMAERDAAPFTTVFVDEAGLLSRATVAALSLLAARRVVLVGDPRQLAPISKVVRLLPTREQRWLASSGLAHLGRPARAPRGVRVLNEQRRMHPDVCAAVSAYQYDGFLTTEATTAQRGSTLSPALAAHGRALWWVLDEEDVPLAEVRAQRGPGQRSWVRPLTAALLQRLLRDPALAEARGLFISPYRAQAQAVHGLLARWGLEGWSASTVHRQQGSEADVVVFDTVNAGSAGWPHDEWKRLVNVALSRAREAVIVLASRDEMREPYLAPLREHLKASVLVDEGDAPRWRAVADTARSHEHGRVAEARAGYRVAEAPGSAAGGLGAQIAARRGQRPVLSREQQRLVDLPLDGKPRLVRGVAGSGKSLVLCHWLAKTVRRFEESRWPDHGVGRAAQVWAVFANRSLESMLRDGVESAWRAGGTDNLFGEQAFPWGRVKLLHVREVLREVLPAGLGRAELERFDYDAAAELFLNTEAGGDGALAGLPRCAALFIDEAQDMGPATLRLLLAMVDPSDAGDTNSRAAHVFYDNAQNIYGRKPPVWSRFGLDMRGRSTVMSESFRSTGPITELAVNVRERLVDAASRLDFKEFERRGLVKTETRGGQPWVVVGFSAVAGPRPTLTTFPNRQNEIDAVGRHLERLIVDEGVKPCDIVMLYNGGWVAERLEAALGPRLAALGVELSRQTSQAFARRDNTLLLTTPASFKGYEAEVVLIPCADAFVAPGQGVLADSLYVAMTRARSILLMYGLESAVGDAGRLVDVLRGCCDVQRVAPGG